MAEGILAGLAGRPHGRPGDIPGSIPRSAVPRRNVRSSSVRLGGGELRGVVIDHVAVRNHENIALLPVR